MRRLRRSIARANGELRRFGYRPLRDIYAPNRNPVKSEPGVGERGKHKAECFKNLESRKTGKGWRRTNIVMRRIVKQLERER